MIKYEKKIVFSCGNVAVTVKEKEEDEEFFF